MPHATPWIEFTRTTVETEHGPLYVRRAGSGQPLLLLHGFPQTGHTFRMIAPALSAHFDVFVPDLPGYGKSPGPESNEDGTPYDKRSVARTMAAMMTEFGADRFLLVGHDRGARVAYRIALDMPEKVAALVSLDTVPTIAVWDGMTYEKAISAFHWPFLAREKSLTEPVLARASDILIGSFLDAWAHIPLADDARERYLSAYRNPAVQVGACADYRAGAGPDIAADRDDVAAGRMIQCPVLVPYGRYYTQTDPAPAWASFAQDVRSIAIDCGHFLSEEAPEALLPLLMRFLQDPR
ncbi:alpha/beta hydrolase [Rhodospirillaceae bacterium KN72]|uniref:Alpha/beta hydrolase n=1 Tax=Pacificispira spongiicola TaxID=2729598 RepID=A0A7Y0DZ57_9PROT|nr:alpha/beta hydrolase [Pacificispira spongiicola]NMM44261.1 alpha/beta hydrolase [Pacificispira spongiicola]